jgi:hypothetical protein
MKALFYIVCLLLLLPNLVVGLALLVLRHTFSTRNPLQMMFDFLVGVIWGPPLAALIIIVLLVAGCISATRTYAAILAFALNTAALTLVLIKIGGPSNFEEALFFLPIVLALSGFAWITYRGFAPEPTAGTVPNGGM